MGMVQEQINTVSGITKKYEELARLSGENFNIFRLLKLDRKEVGTHSMFLAELLNAKGTHGQGDTFLRIFLAQQCQKH